MATDKRRTCGICGARARFMGSHVLSEHVPYAAGQDAIQAALAAERDARASRDYATRRADLGWESYGHAEGYGTLAEMPEWRRRLVAKDMTAYSVER